jgi:hypothetical protein
MLKLSLRVAQEFRRDRFLIGDAQPVHVEKTSGHFALRFSLMLTIVYGRIPDALAKKCAERTKALKTNFKANVSDSQSAVSEQLFGLFNSPVNQILVRSGRKLLPKPAQKMVAGQTCFAGNLIQIDRFLIALVDELARATESLVNLASGIDFDVSHFVRGFYCEIGENRKLEARPLGTATRREVAIHN